jgi:predicted dehydrogenase
MSHQTLGAGIIGAGVISSDHARAYTQLAPRVRLIGLADVDQVRARRSAQNFFIPVVTADYHELLRRNDIQIVSICTPPSLHEQMVVDALEAGKYVLCEKPLAHNLASADRILEAAARHPNRLSVVYQKRFTPDVQRTAWLAQEGHLGRLQFGRFTRVSQIPPQHRTGKSWWGKWDVAGGGALMTQCIHELDAQLLFFGPAKRVIAAMATLASPIESEDTLSATVEHQSGAIVSIACAVGHHVTARVQWDVMGPDAAVHYPWMINCSDRAKRADLQREATKRFSSGQKKSILPGKLDKIVRFAKRKLGFSNRNVPSEHTPYVKAVLDAIDAGGPLPSSGEEARQSLELCIAIYTAAITGHSVDLPLGEDATFYDGITTGDYHSEVWRPRQTFEVQEAHR